MPDGRIAARLQELGIELPEPSRPVANYVPFVRSGNLVFIAGQVPRWNGELKFTGRGGIVYLAHVITAQPAVKHVIAATRGNHGQSVAYAAERWLC